MIATASMEREYEYKVKLSAILPLGVFLAVAAIVFGVVAFTNDRALTLNGVFLPRDVATAFYWIAAVGFGLTVVAMIYRVMLTQRIVLTSTGIVLPKSDWSSKEQLVPYPSIAGTRELKKPSPILLTHTRGCLIPPLVGLASAIYNKEVYY